MAAASAATANSGMPSSPNDSKRTLNKNEDPPKVEVTNASTEAPSDAKPALANGPLAPPPKPQSNETDYFSGQHSSNPNPFALEPNVFDQSFAPVGDTPGRTVLPPVANITSPSPLPGITPGWQSLRTGPLSPAMLSGPATQTDYFSESFRGFPTPNESSLRTGLTPGGGGSMFPAPSPNTQALFNLQSGIATPSTADFQQSALRAAAQANQSKYPPTSAPALHSQPEATTSMSQPAGFPTSHPGQSARGQADSYNHNDVSNAANDLLSFATQTSSTRNGMPYAMPSQAAQSNNMGHMPVQPVGADRSRRNTKGSINSMNSLAGSADTADFSESGQSEQKTTTRSRTRKTTANGNTKSGAKRKADETKANSRKKANTGASLNGMEDDSEEETSPKPEDNKKMTDEEKRKNFLERNRVAALKCRQRKKQWLQNLQSKVELFAAENDTLTATVTQLREEIVNLKTVLLAHKECPVSISQGISGLNMNAFLGHPANPSGELAHQNPYGMAQMQPNGIPMSMPMQSGHMQNRG